MTEFSGRSICIAVAITVGAAAVFSRKVTVRPDIEIPIRNGGVSAYTISLGYSLGGKK